MEHLPPPCTVFTLCLLLCINLTTLPAEGLPSERDRKDESETFWLYFQSHIMSSCSRPHPPLSLFSLSPSHLFPGVMFMLLLTFQNTFDSIQGKSQCAGMSRHQVHQRSLLFTSERLHDLSAIKTRIISVHTKQCFLLKKWLYVTIRHRWFGILHHALITTFTCSKNRLGIVYHTSNVNWMWKWNTKSVYVTRHPLWSTHLRS